MQRNKKTKHAHRNDSKKSVPTNITNFINTVTSYVQRGPRGAKALAFGDNKLRLTGTLTNLKREHKNLGEHLPADVVVFVKNKLGIAV